MNWCLPTVWNTFQTVPYFPWLKNRCIYTKWNMNEETKKKFQHQCVYYFSSLDILFADLPGCSVFFHSKYADKSSWAHLSSSFRKNKDHTSWCSIYGNISCHTKWIFSLSDCQPLPDQTRQHQLLLLFQTLGSLSWHLHILHLQVYRFQSCQWMEIILKSRVNTNGFPVKGFYFFVKS